MKVTIHREYKVTQDPLTGGFVRDEEPRYTAIRDMTLLYETNDLDVLGGFIDAMSVFGIEYEVKF